MEALGTAETLLPNVATLAEGPRWDMRTQRLLWVDIEGCALHEYDPEADEDRAIRLPSMVGSVALTADPGRVLVGLADGLARVDLGSGDIEPLAEFPHSREGMRANDGGVDPAGRFWIGTMCLDETPDRAALYRYDPDGTLTSVLEPVSLSNGIGWAAGEQRMYYIDSPTKRVDVLDYDAATGEVANRRPFALIEDGIGVPDGLALDVEDGVWVALYGGAQVRRYGPSGSLDAVLQVPAENVTACAFGGEDGRRLFVTTAESPQPEGGSLFTAEPGIAGPPARIFGA
jgi:sugar lactone lactonase YvrE